MLSERSEARLGIGRSYDSFSVPSSVPDNVINSAASGNVALSEPFLWGIDADMMMADDGHFYI